ncbi:MAG: HAMP domain-containing histidine kinase [Gemmatimonadetes bacterium]|nr:HAMP domain-containing histidine kinase [Gemmatimonadota bacterium]
MYRRHWPTALGLLAAMMLGWYLIYTELLVREMRRDSVAHSRIYVHILRGLNDPTEGAAEQTLLDLIEEVQALEVPIVVTDADGIPAFVSNLPFDADPTELNDQIRIARYTRDLARRNTPVVEPGLGTIYFGDPPIVGRLRWVPMLQVGALLVLFAAAFWMIRHNLRVERERIWAAMARESAHQVATPLSSLEGWVEILRLPAEEREPLASISAVAAEMEADLERLEKVSRRFEWIGRPVRREPVDVPALLRGLERYVRVRLPQLGRGVELRIEAATELPPVLGNAVLLEWALENLIKNALDALAGSGGSIVVEADATIRRRVAIRVSDDGPGVAPALRRRIFEPGVTTKTSGWGVGLSLSRRIVEDVHGGRLVLEPTEQGATFVMTLPSADGAERSD